MLFADTVAGVPTDAAQWTQTILQGGALAMVWYLVSSLAPKWVREAREEREQMASVAKAERDASREERSMRDRVLKEIIDTLNVRFEGRSKEIVSTIKEQTAAMTGALKDQTSTFAKSLEQSSRRIEAAMDKVCHQRFQAPDTAIRPREEDDQ